MSFANIFPQFVAYLLILLTMNFGSKAHLGSNLWMNLGETAASSELQFPPLSHTVQGWNEILEMQSPHTQTAE